MPIRRHRRASAPPARRRAGAQAQGPADGETWHIVRPGETLEQHRHPLPGSRSSSGQVLHRLNPGITDPNRIEPGQRVRIPTQRPVRLDADPQPAVAPGRGAAVADPLEAAQVGDVLVERDGVRTYRKSSAELRFSDGAKLTVTEDSLVFLRRSAAVLQGWSAIDRDRGRAGRPGGRAATPTARAGRGDRHRQDPGDLEARPLRRLPDPRPQSGRGRQLMVYGGDSEVEAGGAKVQVPRGMGTSVALTGPLSPPQPRLRPRRAPRREPAPSGPAPIRVLPGGGARGRVLHRRGLPRPRLRRAARAADGPAGPAVAPYGSPPPRPARSARDGPQPLRPRRLSQRGVAARASPRTAWGSRRSRGSSP